jgi:seryl-tRNA synthetase
MADRNVEAYKKSITKCVDEWSTKHAKLAKQVADVVKQLDALKKQAGEIETETGESLKKLGLSVVAIKVPKDADQKELDKVPAWLDKLIASKAAASQQHIRVNPSATYITNGLIVTASWFFPDGFSKLGQ